MFKKFFKGILFSILSAAVLLVVLFLVGDYVYRTIAPRPEVFAYPSLPESTKIYARDGTLIYEIYKEEKRTPVSLSEIATPLQQAMVAVEDKDFYSHFGLSPAGIARSFILDMATGSANYGGSTITQQVVKNVLKPGQKNLATKLSEAVWAVALENKYSKDQILAMYLNAIPFGRNTYGAEAAALSYFGKPAKNLSLAESAYLAALPNAPSIYNPDGGSRTNLEARKNLILREMLAQGDINLTDFQIAKDQTVNFLPDNPPFMAPHFVMWIKQELIKKYGEDYVATGGLKVYTSLDLTLQGQAEQAVAKFADINARKYNANNEALVAVEPKTGQVLAMVGSKDYFSASQNCKESGCEFDPNTNVATALRQPGSSFKPYVYATAFSPKFSFNTGSIVLDVARNFSGDTNQPYRPQNYNGAQHGRVTLRKALAGSLNIATVDLETKIGTESIIETAHALGLKNQFIDCGLALALGGCEITLLEHTAGMAAFANNGAYNQYTGILKVTDKYGRVLETFTAKPEQVIDPQANYELDSILSDNNARAFVFGKNAPLTLPDRAVIAKTGTTQNWKDGWTVGGTPDIMAGVWAGNNNGEVMAKGADGVFVAAPIWQAFMKAANANFSTKEFIRPKGVSEVSLNSYTGQIALPGQRATLEISSSYALPQQPEIKIAAAPAVIDPNAGLTFAAAKIMEPKDGEVVTDGAVNVVAAAETGYGTLVNLYVDDQLVQSAQAPNFVWLLPAGRLKSGPHKLSIIAVNQAGYRSQDSVIITVPGNLASVMP